MALAIFLAGCSGDAGPDDATERSGNRATPATIHVVSQNLLHGTACPADSNRCELAARVELFMRQLDEAGCPEIVGIQEANEQTVARLADHLATTCDGRYEIVWDDDPSLDREVVLTTEKVLGSQRRRLAGPLRTALWVRLATDAGIVDFVVTHLASSSDDRPCDDETCPPPCTSADSLNDCQGRQVVDLANDIAHDDAVVIVGGDLNAKPSEPAVAALTDAGFVDTHVAAGNPECDPASGDHCTSGRADDSLVDLRDPTSRQSERIDYLFLGGRRDCTVGAPTGLLGGGGREEGLAFPSDHTGVIATIECETTDEQREAADDTDATIPSTTTTTSATPTEPDRATTEAITAAFRDLFDGSVTDVERKLAALEDGELLRDVFLEAYAAQAAIAGRIRVRIDAVDVTASDRADVTYTLLLDGSAVLDHLPGTAVHNGERWQVSRRTYCDVSTQGAEEIPPPCA